MEQLREYLVLLDKVTNDLEQAFKERDSAENSFKIAKSKVESLRNQKDLIKEKIMAEKVLIKEIK